MKKLACVFPGQGSQYTGMAHDLYAQWTEVRDIFDQASEVLGYDLADICFHSDKNDLKQTDVAQPAILTSGYAAYQVYKKEYALKPSFLAGHSLGEITALTCANSISFTDAVALVRKRGELMKAAITDQEVGMMAVMNMDSSMIHFYCQEVMSQGDKVYISTYNANNQVVVSGELAGLKKLESIVVDKGAQTTYLEVSAPFHCPFMETAAKDLRRYLYGLQFQEMEVPVMSNVTALPYVGSVSIIHNLVEQMTSPVQWNQEQYFLEAQDVDTVIDVGPKATLRNMFRRSLPQIKSFSLDKEEDRNQIVEQLKNRVMDKRLLINRCLAFIVCTQNRNDNEEEYRNCVITPYNKLKKMAEDLEEADQEPDESHLTFALHVMMDALTAKKADEQERGMRLQQLIEETQSEPDYIRSLLA